MAHDRPATESGSGSDNDEDKQSVASDSSTMATKDDFKVNLLKAIKDIKIVGKFAFDEEIEIPEDFNISVQGVGDIKLPLKKAQAMKIITQARQAPFGRGSDTIVDTSVRKTWELDPEQFTIGGGEWSDYLQELCELVAQKMGINTPVHAELYKMLLYEKGAMFKAHTDTEKIPNMFGTLVISLPSKHKGGEVFLEHCGEEIVYESSKSQASCAAWYSDVHHEVLPVKSGYRWVLAYNLAIDQSSPRTFDTFSETELQPLRELVGGWLAQEQKDRKTPYACHVLDHEYTQANISQKSLKGADMTRFMALQQALEGCPVTMTLDIYPDPFKGYHPPLYSVDETVCRLKTLRDLQGDAVTDELVITENYILDPSAFKGVKSEKAYEFSGNSGTTATHWYRGSTIVIVPRDSVAGLLSQLDSHRDSSPEMQIKYIMHLCSQPDMQDHLINTMVGLVENVMPKLEIYPDLMKDKSVLPKVVRIALQYERYHFVEDILAKFYKILPSDLFTWLRQWVIEPDDDDGKTLDNFNKLKKGLSLAMASKDGLVHKRKVVSHFVPLPSDLPTDPLPTPGPILEWTRQTLQNMFDGDGPTEVTTDDASPAVDFSLYSEHPVVFLKELVVPLFQRWPLAPGFRFMTLARVMALIDEDKLPRQEGMDLYRTMAGSLIESQDFASLQHPTTILKQSKKRELPPWLTPNMWAQRRLGNAVTHNDMRDFFSGLLKASTKSNNVSGQFMSKITKQLDRLSEASFQLMWLPFLRSIIPLLENESISLSTPTYKKFFSAVTRGILDNFLGPEPRKPWTWALTGVPCDCSDCERVSAFLRHHTKMSEEYPMNKPRRNHVQQVLEKAGVGCNIRTRRDTSPYPLVVTKTSRPQGVKLEAWKKRRDQVLEEFDQIQPHHLKKLLGKECETIEQLRAGQKDQENMSQGPQTGEKRGVDK
ncbi:hypothetical protein FOC4_g10011006 [Fusarium odoratissimum]|uniref:Prolyl 4-hydroxylase alpha subunit Fe(2+) 2OG dioxygenase domain-containing protein n=1 Tax=Fusarium oxysporum f. sp. cubense (strain race 4) TaxID=2502994 RepID=N1RKY4_FUSC4|nr:hypothetical protein FOC4_g10011006 [Fusarium odoratissimum]